MPRGDAPGFPPRRVDAHIDGLTPPGSVYHGRRTARRTRGTRGLHTGEHHREEPVRRRHLDLDGVVTQTAAVHAAAWKRLFDAYLGERAARAGTSPGGAPDALRPFDLEATTGSTSTANHATTVRDFLASRGIELPLGDPSDPPERKTVCGLRQPQERLLQRRGAGSIGVERSPPPSSSSTSCTTPAWSSASCRRARTPPW